MSLQIDTKRTVKDFYETPVFEKARVKHPEEINDYLVKEEAYLRDNIKYGSYVAEIGCGDGRIIRALCGITDRVVGLDDAKYQTRQAKDNMVDSEIVRGDARIMPIRDNSVDHVLYMWNTLGNIVDERARALNESKRILKPDGTIILSVYSENALVAQLKTYKSLGLHVEKIDADIVHTEEGLKSEKFSREKLQKIIDDVGGLYAEIKELTPISYICELRKSG